MQQHYRSDRVSISLRTKSEATAARSAKSISASAAINKWLKPRVPDGCDVHSYMHILIDRLREVECPSDVGDAIGGWSTEGIGQGYGLGLKVRWMQRIV